MLEVVLAWLAVATPWILLGVGILGVLLLITRMIAKTAKSASGG